MSPGDCIICGISFATFKEEITIDYPEQTHQAGESYAERRRRRIAFEAGMNAGSFILVRLDRNRNQVASDN